MGLNSPWLIPLLTELEHGMLRGMMQRNKEAAAARKDGDGGGRLIGSGNGEEQQRAPVSTIGSEFLQIGGQE